MMHDHRPAPSGWGTTNLWLYPILFLVAADLALVLLGYLRTQMEVGQALYSMDNRFYHQYAVQSYDALQKSWQAWWEFLQFSLRQDTNILYAAPLLPFMEFFGPDRPIYIAALMGIYVGLLGLAAGAIARETIIGRPSWALALGFLFAGFLPATVWAASYSLPDAGGAALVALAMLVYLQAPGRPSLPRIVLIGILIAGGTLFRRHLAYPGLAVYAAIGVDRIWLALTAFSAWRPRIFRILRDGLIFAIAPLVTVIVMYVISPEFTKHAITENYAVLYNSYRLSVGQILSTMRSVLGLLIVILVAAGYAVGLITGAMRRRQTVFVIIFLVVWLAIWFIVVRQVATQYFTHAFPVVVAVGLVGLCASVLRNPLPRIVRGAAFFLVVAASLANFMASALPWLRYGTPVQKQAEIWLAGPIWLMQTPSYDEIVRLAKYLASRTTSKDSVYVAASSSFNSDALLSARDVLPAKQRFDFTMSPVPQINSGTSSPSDSLPKRIMS